MKSQQYLIDLIHTQPTDEVIGEYGQFLFIKMLSTQEGLQFLQQNNWLNNKRREWSRQMHTKYTHMLETALLLSVSGDSYKQGAEEEEEDWLPYHLLYEDRSDEEELYAEYLTQFPWAMTVAIIAPNNKNNKNNNKNSESGSGGKAISIQTDCFFDHNCFYYRSNRRSPIGLGAGVVAMPIDGPVSIADGNARIRISLSIGDGCLSELYSKKSLTKVLSMKDLIRYKECSVIIEDQIYVFFAKNGKLNRIFWSLSAVRSNKKVTQSLVRPLPHFYGELAKTNEGCTYILSSDEFNMDLQEFIFTVHSAFLEMVEIKGKMKGDEDGDDYKDNYTIDSAGTLVDNNSNLQLRSCLWALGMIGSSPTGLNLLNSLCNNSNGINIIDDICILTLESPTLSIRGTCLYVLGLLSRTQIGMQQLSKYGFGFPADNLELDLAVAIPEDVDDFFRNLQEAHGSPSYVKSPHVVSSAISCYSPPHLCRPNNMKPLDPNELLGKQGHTEETILAHISSLCNNVTQKSSASALHGLRMRKPAVFTNPLLFRETLKLLNTYQFKLAAKRFILFNLFDQVILDHDTCELFNESLEKKPVLKYKEIRQWRFNYKQSLIEKQKQRKHHKKYSSNSHHRVHSNKQKRRVHSMNIATEKQMKKKAQNVFNHQQNININMNMPPPPPKQQQQKPIVNANNPNQKNNANSYASKLSQKLARAQQQQQPSQPHQQPQPQPHQQQSPEEVNIVVRGRNRSDANTQNTKPMNVPQNNPYSISSQFGKKIRQKPPMRQQPQPPHAAGANKWDTKTQISIGNGIQRRISELQGGKPNQGQEYAESPTKHVAGPNPLQGDQSQNYD